MSGSRVASGAELQTGLYLHTPPYKEANVGITKKASFDLACEVSKLIDNPFEQQAPLSTQSRNS